MNASAYIPERRFKLSPRLWFAVGALYEFGLCELDFVTPPRMSFVLFYMLGVAWIGWASGGPLAILLAASAAGLTATHDWVFAADGPPWIFLWNAATRFLIMAAAGIAASELKRLTRNLERLVERRTAQWRKEAEEHKATSGRLAETLELNQKILAESAMGIAAYQASGECVFANGALARIAGGTREEILAGNFRQLEGWKNSGLLRMAEEVLERGEPRSGEFRDQTRFGKTVWVDCHMTPFISRGRPHLLVLGYDVTERKRMEQQILEVTDREQARIGQELHDGLCQQLVSVAFDANALEGQLRRARRAEAATAQRIAKFLDEAITEARQLSRGLFPVRLAVEGLPSALQELARATHERFDLRCRFECAEPVLLPHPSVGTHLYRIAQEAVSNAVKHSHGTWICIRLKADPAELQLQIEDNGTGFPKPPPPPASNSSGNTSGAATEPAKLAGMGFHIMDYRARSIGGTLRRGRGTEGGALLCCSVPLNNESDKNQLTSEKLD